MVGLAALDPPYIHSAALLLRSSGTRNLFSLPMNTPG